MEKLGPLFDALLALEDYLNIDLRSDGFTLVVRYDTGTTSKADPFRLDDKVEAAALAFEFPEGWEYDGTSKSPDNVAGERHYHFYTRT